MGTMMKSFALRKRGAPDEDAEPDEVVAQGSLEYVVEFASANGLIWDKNSRHHLGACFIKVIGPDTVEVYDLAPVSPADDADESESTQTVASPVGQNEFAVRARMAEVIEYARKNDLKFRKLIKDEPAARSFAWWALENGEADKNEEES